MSCAITGVPSLWTDAALIRRAFAPQLHDFSKRMGPFSNTSASLRPVSLLGPAPWLHALECDERNRAEVLRVLALTCLAGSQGGCCSIWPCTQLLRPGSPRFWLDLPPVGNSGVLAGR